MFVPSVVLATMIALTPTDYAPPEGAKLSWKTVLADKDEPGESMTVSGTLYNADGKTPVAGAVVYAYHTDIRGYYSKERRGPSDPRLKGWMRTDAKGRFQFKSIRPGAYPQGRIAAHVHFFVTPPGKRQQPFELLFEGDPLLAEGIEQKANNGGYYLLRPLERDSDGVWRCTADIILRP